MRRFAADVAVAVDPLLIGAADWAFLMDLLREDAGLEVRRAA